MAVGEAGKYLSVLNMQELTINQDTWDRFRNIHDFVNTTLH